MFDRLARNDIANVATWIAAAENELDLGRSKRGTGGYFEARRMLQLGMRHCGMVMPLVDALGTLNVEHEMRRDAEACMHFIMRQWPGKPSMLQLNTILERQRRIRDTLFPDVDVDRESCDD